MSVFFALLIVSRLIGFEEMLREDLRNLLDSRGLVAERRSIQGPIVALALTVSGAIAMAAFYWVARRVSGRRNVALAAAVGGCGVMLTTIALRTVSLHSLDRLLNGPLKLNWVGDIGASFAVLIAAVLYARIVSGKIPRRR